MAESLTGVNSAQAQELFGEARKNWVWLFMLGIIFVLLGLVGLGSLFALTMVTMFFIGALLILGGVLQLLDAFKCQGWKGFGLHIVMAILYIIAGVAIIGDPVFASVFLTWVIAAALVALGILRIGMALQMKKTGSWLWPLLGGILSIILGVLIFAQWPVSGMFVIGLFVAIDLIIHGWSYIFIALAAKSGAQAPEAKPTEAAT
jgi:uncharacterized membrane protein HdeD (DUF308 family)